MTNPAVSEEMVERLRKAGCTSPDGTFVHASTEQVVAALSALPLPVEWVTDEMVKAYRSKYREIWPGSHPDVVTAKELLTAAISVAVGGALPADVVRLVIAARKVAFGDAADNELRELDAASEAFAERVPWDDEDTIARLATPAAGPSAVVVKALRELLVEADEALFVIAGGSIAEEGETVEQLERIIEANRECARNGQKMTQKALSCLSTLTPSAADPFPTPARNDGGEPCGECHIRPGETCDLCGAVNPALASPSAEAAQPVARKRFPILGSGGQSIDHALVADHGKQAQKNHYQTVDGLAGRGGLSWCELYAVLHDKPWKQMDENEAILACRALETRYLATLSQPQGELREGMEAAAKIAEQQIDTYNPGQSAVDVRMSFTRGPRWKDGPAIAAAIRAALAGRAAG